MRITSIRGKFIFAVVVFTILILTLWLGFYFLAYRAIAAAGIYEVQYPNREMFIITSVVVLVAVFIAVFALFRYLSVYIIKPITEIIDTVASLDGKPEHRLPRASLAGKPGFDSFVYAINDLIDKTDQYRKELLLQKQMLYDSDILQRDMRIGLLTSQIDAHFVVNTIASIHTLAAQGENMRAARMADGLAQIIKHRHTGDELRNLFFEIEMVNEYIDIMNIRFDGKFNAEYDFDDRLVEYQIPGFIIQPAVENALIHGLQNKDGKAQIRICGYIENDTVIIEVYDNGLGISPPRLSELQNALESCETGDFPDPGLSGVALPNIQRRILLWFGKDYGVSVESTPFEGTTVTIRLPAIREI